MWLTEVSLLVGLTRVSELLETHSLVAQLLVEYLVLTNDKIKLTDGFPKKWFYG